MPTCDRTEARSAAYAKSRQTRIFNHLNPARKAVAVRAATAGLFDFRSRERVQVTVAP